MDLLVQTGELTTAGITIISLLVVWTFFWKGLALYRAARRGQKGWFIALLLINTIGILDIIYLLLTRHQTHPDRRPR